MVELAFLTMYFLFLLVSECRRKDFCLHSIGLCLIVLPSLCSMLTAHWEKR